MGSDREWKEEAGRYERQGGLERSMKSDPARQGAGSRGAS